MLIEHIFLGFCGLAAGLAVSAGTFAFLIVIGVIPRMIGKCNRAAETMHFENAVILGGICGNLASVFLQIRIPLVVVLPILTKRRTQCSMLCPFGAFAFLTDKLSPFKMRIDTEKCKGCMKCAQACLFGAIDVATIQQKKNSPEITCAKCGECVAVCPEKAISYQFRFNKGSM